MVSSFYVGQYEKMDPETEDLIFGQALQVGMEVLVESQFRTAPLAEGFYGSGAAENIQANRDVDSRWCQIQEFKSRKVTDVVDGVRPRWFIGVYADGTKAVRMTLPHTGWLVKKASIPASQRPEELDPRPEWYQDLYCEITGHMRHNVNWSKIRLVTGYERGGPHFEEVTDYTTLKIWPINHTNWEELDRNLKEL